MKDDCSRTAHQTTITFRSLRWLRWLASARIIIVCTLLGLPLSLSACSPFPEIQSGSLFPSPVTYVTAGPLPQATATATLPPIVKPTDIPATLAPKKLPLESTSAIGLWSDQITSTQTFTGVVDIAMGSAAVQMEQTDLALVSLTRREVYYGYGSDITDVVANHPSWVLHDKNGKVVYAKTGDQEPLLDIRNDDVKNQLADDVSKLIQAGPYDGIILDGVGDELIRSTSPPVVTGTTLFKDPQRQSAVEGLLRTIRAKIPNKVLIIGGYAWSDGEAYAAHTSEAQSLADLVDGVHIDEFLRAPISGTNKYKSEADWKRDVDYLSAISKDNKIVLITTRLYDSNAPTNTVRAWFMYSVASYLLGKNGTRTYFQFDAQGNLSYAMDPLLSAPIGAPQDAYTKLSSGIYQRLFANGIVLVNPTTKTKDTQLQGKYHILGTNEAVDKITLLPHTGEILLKVS